MTVTLDFNDSDYGFHLGRQVTFIKVQIGKWVTLPYIGYSIFVYCGGETSLKIIKIPKAKQKTFKITFFMNVLLRKIKKVLNFFQNNVSY